MSVVPSLNVHGSFVGFYMFSNTFRMLLDDSYSTF